MFDIPDLRMTEAALQSLGVDLGRWYRDDGGWPRAHRTLHAEMALHAGAR